MKKLNTVNDIVSKRKMIKMTGETFKRKKTWIMGKDDLQVCAKESIKYEQKKNLLKDHWEKYFNYCNRMNNTNDYCSGSMEMVIESLKIYPIKCIKYNSTLDDSVQSK